MLQMTLNGIGFSLKLVFFALKVRKSLRWKKWGFEKALTQKKTFVQQSCCIISTLRHSRRYIFVTVVHECNLGCPSILLFIYALTVDTCGHNRDPH